MRDTVDITLSVEPETARILANPEVRAVIATEVDRLARRHAADSLMRAVAALKAEAHARGLTDEIVDEELADWNAERRGHQPPPIA